MWVKGEGPRLKNVWPESHDHGLVIGSLNQVFLPKKNSTSWALTSAVDRRTDGLCMDTFRHGAKQA